MERTIVPDHDLKHLNFVTHHEILSRQGHITLWLLYIARRRCNAHTFILPTWKLLQHVVKIFRFFSLLFYKTFILRKSLIYKISKV